MTDTINTEPTEPQLIELPLDASKPERTLLSLDLPKLSATLGWPITVSYYVFFTAQGETAGNHWHREKRELFLCLQGELRVSTVDISTGRIERRILTSYPRHGERLIRALYIPTGTPHAVRSLTPDSILLVLANQPPRTPEDDHEYTVPPL
ncbi:MAG: WxcM-like domain-containing protein [bacterium]